MQTQRQKFWSPPGSSFKYGKAIYSQAQDGLTYFDAT